MNASVDGSTHLNLSRAAGIAAGVATHALFAFTVWHLFWFLRDGRASAGEGNLWIDAALALLFAVPHSLLLWPPARKQIGRVIPAAFYGLFYTVVTCVSLLAVFHYWQGSTTMLWHAQGSAETVIAVGFYASWIGLFYSLHLTGLGFQTGLTPWLHWVLRRKPPRREFRVRGAYRWLRHPVYFSFMGLVWFTPHMSLDHVVLTGIWTAYLFVGSYLKDRRLAYYVGEEYREYQTRVPGFPLMPFGPLAKRRSRGATSSMAA